MNERLFIILSNCGAYQLELLRFLSFAPHYSGSYLMACSQYRTSKPYSYRLPSHKPYGRPALLLVVAQVVFQVVLINQHNLKHNLRHNKKQGRATVWFM